MTRRATAAARTSASCSRQSLAILIDGIFAAESSRLAAPRQPYRAGSAETRCTIVLCCRRPFNHWRNTGIHSNRKVAVSRLRTETNARNGARSPDVNRRPTRGNRRSWYVFRRWRSSNRNDVCHPCHGSAGGSGTLIIDTNREYSVRIYPAVVRRRPRERSGRHQIGSNRRRRRRHWGRLHDGELNSSDQQVPRSRGCRRRHVVGHGRGAGTAKGWVHCDERCK